MSVAESLAISVIRLLAGQAANSVGGKRRVRSDQERHAVRKKNLETNKRTQVTDQNDVRLIDDKEDGANDSRYTQGSPKRGRVDNSVAETAEVVRTIWTNEPEAQRSYTTTTLATRRDQVTS